MLGQGGLRHAEKLGLRRVGIGHEAAFEHRRGSGDVGQRGGDHAAGAGFRRGQHDPGLA